MISELNTLIKHDNYSEYLLLQWFPDYFLKNCSNGGESIHYSGYLGVFFNKICSYKRRNKKLSVLGSINALKYLRTTIGCYYLYSASCHYFSVIECIRIAISQYLKNGRTAMTKRWTFYSMFECSLRFGIESGALIAYHHLHPIR